MENHGKYLDEMVAKTANDIFHGVAHATTSVPGEREKAWEWSDGNGKERKHYIFSHLPSTAFPGRQ